MKPCDRCKRLGFAALALVFSIFFSLVALLAARFAGADWTDNVFLPIVAVMAILVLLVLIDYRSHLFRECKH